MNGRRTNIKLIEKAVCEGWVKQLAFYHLLKLQYNNSCIYDYKSRIKEIAGKLCVSESTIYRYVKVLRSKDLVFDHASNLCLKSIREFKGGKKTALIIPENYNLFDLTCMLYAKLIEKKARQMAFSESLRRSLRGDRFNDRLCESPFRPSLSMRNIAKLCNTSLQTTKLVIINLERLNIMKTEKQKAEF
jgi:DNA-binding MarR family transcriptional regulator